MKNFNRILNMQDILNQNVNVFNLAWTGFGVSGDQLQYQNRRFHDSIYVIRSNILYSKLFNNHL